VLHFWNATAVLAATNIQPWYNFNAMNHNAATRATRRAVHCRTADCWHFLVTFGMANNSSDTALRTAVGGGRAMVRRALASVRLLWRETVYHRFLFHHSLRAEHAAL